MVADDLMAVVIVLIVVSFIVCLFLGMNFDINLPNDLLFWIVFVGVLVLCGLIVLIKCLYAKSIEAGEERQREIEEVEQKQKEKDEERQREIERNERRRINNLNEIQSLEKKQSDLLSLYDKFSENDFHDVNDSKTKNDVKDGAK